MDRFSETGNLAYIILPDSFYEKFGLDKKRENVLNQMIGAEDVIEDGAVVISKHEAPIKTPRMYRTPIQIDMVAKTYNTNLRFGYGGTVIFNWEAKPEELRLGGGPAGRQGKEGAGLLPKNEFVHIKFIMTKTLMAIYVNGELRFDTKADFSQVNEQFGIWTAWYSKIAVKYVSITHGK
jgi:hypothetical protein